jgi:hypothetical protein
MNLPERLFVEERRSKLSPLLFLPCTPTHARLPDPTRLIPFRPLRKGGRTYPTADARKGMGQCHSGGDGGDRALAGMRTAQPGRPDPAAFPGTGTAPGTCHPTHGGSKRPGRVLTAPRRATGPRQLPPGPARRDVSSGTCHSASAGRAPGPRADPAPPGRQGVPAALPGFGTARCL